jgi:hypothetical protein
MSESTQTPDGGAAADLVARLKETEAHTAEVIQMRVSATGPYAHAINYLASPELDPVFRHQEMQEIAEGISKESGRRVTIGALKEAVEQLQRARKEADKQAQLPEFEQLEDAVDREGRPTIRVIPPLSL